MNKSESFLEQELFETNHIVFRFLIKQLMPTSYSKQPLNILFASCFLMAACYHTYALWLHNVGSPIWRHALFIAINLICMYGMIIPFRFFNYFLIMFLVQQFYSHGSNLVLHWKTEHAIHWPSVLVILIVPVITIYGWKRTHNK